MENETQDKSRTQIKKEAEELQRLGLELTKLTRQQLELIDIPDKLRTAVIEAQSITSNIAGRRQKQYIGALMRDVDPEQIRTALLEADASFSTESESAEQTRIWLDKLLLGDSDSIEAVMNFCPGLDRQRLMQLLRNIKKKGKTGKSSTSFKTLKQLISKSITDSCKIQ